MIRRFIKYLFQKFKDFYNNDDKFDSINISSLYPDLVLEINIIKIGDKTLNFLKSPY